MDFNKWIYEGIPYLNAPEQENLQRTMFPPEKAEKKQKENGTITLRTPQDKVQPLTRFFCFFLTPFETRKQLTTTGVRRKRDADDHNMG